MGLDGHEIGALLVSQALRDAGMEVIYLGLNRTPEEVVEAAIQEDVDVIGISSMSGVHDVALPELMELLRDRGAEGIIVIAGGVIPPEDIRMLEEAGVRRVFPAGTRTSQIVEFLQSEVGLPRT
jgi:methylmalonyl-CoA mutase C-terminal domain/subunit